MPSPQSPPSPIILQPEIDPDLLCLDPAPHSISGEALQSSHSLHLQHLQQ